MLGGISIRREADIWHIAVFGAIGLYLDFKQREKGINLRNVDDCLAAGVGERLSSRICGGTNDS